MKNTATQSKPIDFRKELQISVMPVLVFLSLLTLTLLLFTGDMNQVMPDKALLSMRISLYLLIILGWVFHGMHETAGKYFLVTAIAAFLVGFAFANQYPQLLILLFIPVGLAAAMLGPRLAIIAAALLAAGTTLLWYAVPNDVPGVYIALAVLAITSMAGLMWSVYRPVYQLGDWIWEYYQRALQMLKETGSTRLDLSQALDELLHTNRQLALSNEKQLSFRIIAEEAQKTKTAFVAKVSHEFRTPLNMIIGLVNLMIDNPHIYGRPLPKAMLDDLLIIQRNCEHLTGMINDVLALSQAESGLMVLHSDYVNLQEIIEQALEVVSPLVKKKGLETTCTVNGQLPLVYCDRTRIRQVLLNLVSNAARFTEQGGIYITVDDRADALQISVRDTGPGISAEDIERIFDPFCQGSTNNTWRDKGGTGLGLTISRQFIELHGGKIWVESQPGSGATFFFNLPKEQPLAPATTPRRWISERWNWVAREGRARFSSDLLRRPRIALYDPACTLVEMLTVYKDLLEFTLSQDLPHLLEDVKGSPANLILVNGESLDDIHQVIDAVRQTVRDTPLVGCIVPRQTWLDQTGSVAKILVKPISHSDLIGAIEGLPQPVRRILMVDNDEEIINLYSRMILAGAQPGRFEVHTATSGREALAYMRAEHPDLVLLDISMPEMDGFAVLAEKDQDPQISMIPVMIVSAIDPHVNPLQSQLLVATMANGLRPAKLVECALELSELLLKPDLIPGQARG